MKKLTCPWSLLESPPPKATAVIAAAFAGDGETLPLLLAANAAPDAATASGATALAAAVEGAGRMECPGRVSGPSCKLRLSFFRWGLIKIGDSRWFPCSTHQKQRVHYRERPQIEPGSVRRRINQSGDSLDDFGPMHGLLQQVVAATGGFARVLPPATFPDVFSRSVAKLLEQCHHGPLENHDEDAEIK